MDGPSLASGKPKKMPPNYPKMHLDLDVIPEAKKWEVADAGTDKGPSYTITLMVKMVGLSQSRFDKSAEFEIRGIEIDDADGDDDTKTSTDTDKDGGEGEDND